MSSVLNMQTRSIETVISRMNELENTTERIFCNEHLVTYGASVESAAQLNQETEDIQEKTDKANEKAEKLKKLWESAGEAVKKTAASLKKAYDIGAQLVSKVFEQDNIQMKAELQLATILNNNGGSADDFEAIKARAAEIQGASMYGDEAMITGAAKLSTYISDAEAVSAMMGTLADYAAGMSGGSGVDVSAMEEYANQLGAVFNGSYDAFAEMGFSLTEAQKDIISNGTDMEKALVIDDVISRSWDDLAAKMKKTPVGMMNSLKNTFTGLGEVIGAQIAPAFMGFMEKVEMFVSSDGFSQMVDSLIVMLNTVFGILTQGINVLQYVADNWSVFGPLVMSAAVALGLFKAGQAASIISQLLFNGALLACPLTWIVAGIGALVGALAIFTNVMNESYGLSLSFAGMLGGVLMTVLAALGNAIYMIWDIVATVVVFVWNIIADLVNFLANVFTDPLGAIARLFFDIFDSILGIIEGVAGAIGNLFGQDWSSGISGFRDDVNKFKEENFGTGVEVVKKLDADELSLKNTFGIDYIDYNEAFKAGYYLGDKMFGGDSDNNPAAYNPDDFIFDDSPSGTADDPLHTNVDNDINIADEDLQLMRDVAEARYVQNFVTLTPTVQVSGNTINEKADIGSIVDEIEYRLESEFAASAEGVYG